MEGLFLAWKHFNEQSCTLFGGKLQKQYHEMSYDSVNVCFSSTTNAVNWLTLTASWFLKMRVHLNTVRNINLSHTQTPQSHHHGIIWKISSTNMIKAPLEPLPSSFLLPHCIFITDAPASYAMFAEFVSVMLHLFPFKHLQASLLKNKWRGERRRKMKSMFTQLKLHSNSIWMGATNFLCTIDVLFISVNVVTLRGRIASLNKTGLWAFIRGSQTQRHLRSLGMCRGKKKILLTPVTSTWVS